MPLFTTDLYTCLEVIDHTGVDQHLRTFRAGGKAEQQGTDRVVACTGLGRKRERERERKRERERERERPESISLDKNKACIYCPIESISLDKNKACI